MKTLVFAILAAAAATTPAAAEQWFNFRNDGNGLAYIRCEAIGDRKDLVGDYEEMFGPENVRAGVTRYENGWAVAEIEVTRPYPKAGEAKFFRVTATNTMEMCQRMVDSLRGEDVAPLPKMVSFN